MNPQTTDTVTSQDGTLISYRQVGSGPGVVLVHGAMQAGQNFSRLAALLSDAFTVYVPDRRGRGQSGPAGEGYSIEKECQDLQALLAKTGTSRVFGLSSGAIISLKTALLTPQLQQLALYEPPLPLDTTPLDWIQQYQQEIERGDLPAAMVTVLKGTGDPSLFRAIPRVLLVPFLRLVMKAEEKKGPKVGELSLASLIPTMRFDSKVVTSQRGALPSYKDVSADVLLLGGNRSARYLTQALDALEKVLPKTRRVRLSGVGHLAADNSEKPGLVANELRRFFQAA